MKMHNEVSMMADIRRLFLDTDNIHRWDTGVLPYFPRPEKVAITGLEPGGLESPDARVAEIYGSVLKEDGLFRMWYFVMPDARSRDMHEGGDHPLVAYAESDDGIHWRKPDLGLTGQRRFPGNNLLALPGGVNGVVHALPGSDFKYLASTIQIMPLEPGVSDAHGFTFNGGGTYLFASDDGLTWRQLIDKPFISHGDVASLVADPARGRYLFYQKVGLMHGLDMRRSFVGMESCDGVHWVGHEGPGNWRECFMADDYDDLLAAQAGLRIADYYSIACYPVNDLYVAVGSMFFMSSPLRFKFAQNPFGIASLRLSFSHDGMHWRHPKGRPEWMGLGEPGDLDAGFLVTASTFVEHGDDLLLYYGGSVYDHGWCVNEDFSLRDGVPLEDQRDSARIGLARLKRDRFAGFRATYRGHITAVEERGRLGNALFVNADTPKGCVRVEIAEAWKTDPLPGFTFDDCVPITVDAVRAPLQYKKARVADLPAGKPLELRFDISIGTVYGYAWGDDA